MEVRGEINVEGEADGMTLDNISDGHELGILLKIEDRTVTTVGGVDDAKVGTMEDDAKVGTMEDDAELIGLREDAMDVKEDFWSLGVLEEKTGRMGSLW